MPYQVLFEKACPINFGDGIIAADMHVHTIHSDGLVPVPELLDYLTKRNLIAAVTDHNAILGVYKSLIKPEGRERIIPGIEVSAVEGPHILVYFERYTDLESYYHLYVKDHVGTCPHMATDLSTEKIVDDAKNAGGIVVGAHPYGYAMLVRGVMKGVSAGVTPLSVTEKLDGLEVICGGLSHGLNIRAEIYAREHNMCMTGGSDAHTLREIGRAITYANDVSSIGEFIEALLARKTDVIGCERNPGDNILMGSQVMSRYIPYVGSGLKVHTKQNIERLRRKIE